MPLNYSKWDKLELSDDSDIEGHPNVDHRSLVNWKRRDIHEKRAARNQKIEDLKAEIAVNNVLLPRLRTITEEVHGAQDAPAQFNRIVSQLREAPSSDAPETPPDSAGAKRKKITYDEMILSLLMKVYEDARAKGLVESGKEERLREALIADLKSHVSRLSERTVELKKELENEEGEKKKKITSEDLHDGWDSHYTPPKPEPAPVKGAKTKTVKSTEFEVLNSSAVNAAQSASIAAKLASSADISADASKDDEVDTDDEEVPELTPSLEAFSQIPLHAFEESFHFIQKHRDVYVPGASDALLVAAFTAQQEGNSTYAKQCVHQSLLIQYCEKLGADGVGLFFKRLLSQDPRARGAAEGIFIKDVEDTYAHIAKRVIETTRERAENAETEQIQLVPEGDSGKISFDVPDGPPPEELRLEGPGTENLNVEDVRKMLQMRWDIFNNFSEPMKKALRSGKLDQVNKVLGRMKVPEAEEVVGLLNNAGILSFASDTIVDETGRRTRAGGEGSAGEENEEDTEEEVKDS